MPVGAANVPVNSGCCCGSVGDSLAAFGGSLVSSFTQSPDLNLIEHLWVHLKKRLREYPTPPKGVHELWERVAEEWDQITPETCQKLIESMPRRVQAVIKAKGGHTKY